MATIDEHVPVGGFQFDMCKRNAMLQEKGVKLPPFTKTGTTICGMTFKDGVVLGADTRSTAGTVVANKNCDKVHHIASNIYCCGAGTAADLDHVTELIRSKLELHRFAVGHTSVHNQSRVVTAMTMFKNHLFPYQGYVSCALVLGGMDLNGPQIYQIHPHGSADCLPYATMGSGSVVAMSIMENEYRDDMSKEEAMDLVSRSIQSGIFNDLGSGSNVDLCVITMDGAQYIKNYQAFDKKTYEAKNLPRPNKGSATILKELVSKLKKFEITDGDATQQSDKDAMET